MDSFLHGQDNNMLCHQLSMEYPPAKKSRPVELIKGNNKYGSKGAIRCEKCRIRKGKCVYEDMDEPCDYCYARKLPCGPKLPTARKQIEQGLTAMMSGVHLMTTPAIQVQTPANTRKPGETFNLSSVSPQEASYAAFPSPNMEYTQYSSIGALASLSPVSLGPVLGQYSPEIVRSWPSYSRSTSATPSTPPKSPAKSRSSVTPPCHPAQSLNMAMLPYISAAIPHCPPSPSVSLPNTQEDTEVDWQFWLRPDSPCPSPTTGRFADQLLKFNRMLRAPRAMVARKLAGKWDEARANTDETVGDKSIRSSPSILCV